MFIFKKTIEEPDLRLYNLNIRYIYMRKVINMDDYVQDMVGKYLYIWDYQSRRRRCIKFTQSDTSLGNNQSNIVRPFKLYIPWITRRPAPRYIHIYIDSVIFNITAERATKWFCGCILSSDRVVRIHVQCSYIHTYIQSTNRI